MMGQQAGMQDRLFYSFNLDTYVPADHLLRRIDRFLDLSELRRHLAPFYSHTGRPSVDPELMIRMLIIGYSFGIRSERRLCEEVQLNLAYRADPRGGKAQSYWIGHYMLLPTAHSDAVRIEGQRARNVCGLPSGDRPQRWGALVTGVWTQRYARMRYVVTGLGAGTDRS